MAVRSTPELDAVVADLRRSRRYGSLGETTLRRIADRALGTEGDRVGAATKRAKRALHEIYGAYVRTPPPYRRLERELSRAVASEEPDAVREQLRRIMLYHASTAERLPVLDEFYEKIFDLTGPPSSVVDVACGLNPLAAPWMPLGAQTIYRALDIDLALVAFVGRFLELLRVPHDVRGADILCERPPSGDVALLLKSLPCIEQQERGAGFRVIDDLDSRVVVASFPTASLGHRAKGLARTHATHFEEEGRRRAWTWERLDFPGELVYVVWK